jgi:hypothetical protein
VNFCAGEEKTHLPTAARAVPTVKPISSSRGLEKVSVDVTKQKSRQLVSSTHISGISDTWELL